MITPEQYQHLWDTTEIIPTRQKELNRVSGSIVFNRHRYEEVSGINCVPWEVIAAIHYRESTLSFKHHLHNGDPLTARTVHVPSGRPLKGNPPFTWEESAIDALKLRNLDKVVKWTVPETLKQLEMYNGGGYWRRGINSPYLWAATSNYGTAPNTGKYVADGKFDINVLDQQLGCAAILKELLFS